MKKVSIIVPIYNAEKYLCECLDSITKQSYKNIEIILINDGSTDNSLKICMDYVNKYNNFILVDIKNAGVSNARNLGIKKSTGDYIAFVDSDDIITEDFIETMVNKVKEDIELVACNYSYQYMDNEVFNNFNLKGKIPSSVAKEELFKDDSIRGFSCNKLFVSSILKNNNIEFNTSIKICEDLLFCFEYLKYTKNIYIINENLYFYRMRKSSASNNNNEKDLTVFEAFKKMYKIDKNIYDYSIDLYTYVFFKYKRLLIKTKKISDVKKISYINCIFNKKIKLKTKIYSILFSILPSNIISMLKSKKQEKFMYYE